jgi:hypothetical protein
LKKEYNRIKTLHKFAIPEEAAFIIGSFSFEIKNGRVQDVMAKIENYLENYLGPMKELTSVVSEGRRVCIGFSFPKFSGADVLGPH